MNNIFKNAMNYIQKYNMQVSKRNGKTQEFPSIKLKIELNIYVRD